IAIRSSAIVYPGAAMDVIQVVRAEFNSASRMRRRAMAQLLPSEYTSFTLDNMGRYLCNSLQEALDSAGQAVAGNGRDFDVIIIGGGTFGSIMAESLFVRDQTRSRRILVLEAGPFVLPEHVQN